MARTGTFDSLEDILSKRRMLFVSATAITSTNITTLAPIAYSTSAGLSLSADDIDVSNLTDGSWQTHLQGKKQGELSVESLVSNVDDEGTLWNAWEQDSDLYFWYGYVTITEDAAGVGTSVTADKTLPYYCGKLKITSLDDSSDNGDVPKFSMSASTQGEVKNAL